MTNVDHSNTSEQHVDRRGWYLGKEIPVAVLLVLAVQTVSVVVWVTQLGSKVESQAEALKRFELVLDKLATAVSNPLPVLSAAKITSLEQEVSAQRALIETLRAEVMAQKLLTQQQSGRR